MIGKALLNNMRRIMLKKVLSGRNISKAESQGKRITICIKSMKRTVIKEANN